MLYIFLIRCKVFCLFICCFFLGKWVLFAKNVVWSGIVFSVGRNTEISEVKLGHKAPWRKCICTDRQYRTNLISAWEFYEHYKQAEEARITLPIFVCRVSPITVPKLLFSCLEPFDAGRAHALTLTSVCRGAVWTELSGGTNIYGMAGEGARRSAEVCGCCRAVSNPRIAVTEHLHSKSLGKLESELSKTR